MKRFWSILAILCALPVTVLAADSFVPLVGIPYVDTRQNVSLGDYVNGLYWAAISIAAVLAVLKIIYAGVQYALADVVTTKAGAKKDIQGALVGLLIVVAAVLILDTINPQIKEITLLNLTPLSIPTGNHPSVTPVIVNIGDTLNECQSTPAEQTEFVQKCNEKGKIITSLDGATACTNLNCVSKDTVDTNPTLTCNGNTCTCTFDADTGQSVCVSECRKKPQYLSYTVSGNIVTCNYSPDVPADQCSVSIGCCGVTNMSNCPQANNPNVCRTDNTVLPGEICYYTATP